MMHKSMPDCIISLVEAEMEGNIVKKKKKSKKTALFTTQLLKEEEFALGQ